VSSPKAPGNDSHAPLHLPLLADGNTDPARLYTFNELLATPGAALEDVHRREDIPVVAVDADVSIEFTNPVANDAAIATDTFTASGVDPGVQRVQDMTVRYALKSISIKRSPRFGSGAGTWTDLVADIDTQLDLAGGGSVHATPAVSFRWDADSRADGVLAPKRLLINSRTPYSLTVGSPQNDEEAVASDEGFPCCRRTRGPGPQNWHALDFTGLQAGTRLPGQQQFSENGALWHWSRPPVTINGMGVTASGSVVALVPVAAGPAGSADFPSPVFAVEMTLDPALLSGRCVLEGYRGLSLLDSASLDPAGPSSNLSLRAKIDTGFTRVVLRVEAGTRHDVQVLSAAALNAPAASGLDAAELLSIRYLTCSEAQLIVGRSQRCRSGSELAATVGGGGKLAFLPNYDYAVTATVEIAVSHKSGGAKTLSSSQPAYFRTKGPVGLNAEPNLGDELRPYVASCYPAAGAFVLYREEPVAVAFTEDLSNLLPVDRVPAPDDPPEKAQLMELTLSIERLASTDGAQRLTVPSSDWLDAHDGVIITVGGLPPLRSSDFLLQLVRRAPSTDRRVLRFEHVLDAYDCQHDPLHPSQVLLHEPVGPNGIPGLWEAQAGLRATVRAKDGPYTRRRSFQLIDVAAFDYRSDNAPARDWSLQAGSMVGPAAGRQYAVLGEPTWNHLQVSTRVDPAGAAAGIAVGVSNTTPVQQAMLALVDGASLVIVRREGGVDREVARSALPAGVGPVDLHVTAFDDRLRAQIGDVTAEADRGPVREGRMALVSVGAARFASLLVDAQEMYQVAFHTSRYASFADHIGAYDPLVPAHPAGAMGAPPSTTPPQIIATHGDAITSVMNETADPQARQALFDSLLSSLSLPRLDRCDRLTFTRLVDASGTSALLIESPEALSFLHDVTLRLFRRMWHRPPWWLEELDLDAHLQALLPTLRISGGQAFASAQLAALLARTASHVVHVDAGEPSALQVFRLTDPGWRTPTPSADATVGGAAAGLGDLLAKPAGTIAAVRADQSIIAATIAPWVHTSAVHQDHPVTYALLSNGDETAALLLPSGALDAGTYILDFAINRSRWTSTTADPKARYQREASVQLSW